MTGCKPQGTSAFTAHISLVYGVYLVFHLSGAIPKPAFKKKESCCFVGRQVHLEFATKDYYLDLLFYHLKLRSYVVVELKSVSFDPGFVGTLNMYLSAVDDLLRHPDDKPSIGLLLCRKGSRIEVEYALRGIQKPMGVAGWETKLVKTLPEELQSKLPSVAEIEAELTWDENEGA